MKVACPTCKKTVEWIPENVHRPFCSKKCQLIDLGEWFDEEKSIAGEAANAENLPKMKSFEFDD